MPYALKKGEVIKGSFRSIAPAAKALEDFALVEMMANEKRGVYESLRHYKSLYEIVIDTSDKKTHTLTKRPQPQPCAFLLVDKHKKIAPLEFKSRESVRKHLAEVHGQDWPYGVGSCSVTLEELLDYGDWEIKKILL